jgi:hypothetical protein
MRLPFSTNNAQKWTAMVAEPYYVRLPFSTNNAQKWTSMVAEPYYVPFAFQHEQCPKIWVAEP